jgi:hydrogenase nickel incorporation protein HypA/HybF
MHELSIALAIVEAVEEEAGRHGGRVRAVHLRLGALSGVVEEALRGAFELARQGTPLSDAELLIEPVAATALCPDCGERPVVSVQDFRCSSCGGPAGEVVRGRELEVFALEVES